MWIRISTMIKPQTAPQLSCKNHQFNIGSLDELQPTLWKLCIIERVLEFSLTQTDFLTLPTKHLSIQKQKSHSPFLKTCLLEFPKSLMPLPPPHLFSWKTNFQKKTSAQKQATIILTFSFHPANAATTWNFSRKLCDLETVLSICLLKSCSGEMKRKTQFG